MDARPDRTPVRGDALPRAPRPWRLRRTGLWAALVVLLLVAQTLLVALTLNYETSRAQETTESVAAEVVSQVRRELKLREEVASDDDGPDTLEALEEPPIHVASDQPIPEVDQRALRERRLRRSEAAEHHLHPQIDEGELDHLCVGHAEIGLDERRHRHQRGRHRVPSGTGVSIHALELRLELVVEEHAPLQPKEAEQLPNSVEALEEHLLLPAQFLGRGPSRDRHPSTRSRRQIGVDPLLHPCGITDRTNRSAI